MLASKSCESECLVMGPRSMHFYHTPQVFLMHNPVWDSLFWLQVSSCIFILQWLKHLLDCFFSSSKFLMNACPHNIHFIVGDTEDWMFSLKCKNSGELVYLARVLDYLQWVLLGPLSTLRGACCSEGCPVSAGMRPAGEDSPGELTSSQPSLRRLH